MSAPESKAAHTPDQLAVAKALADCVIDYRFKSLMSPHWGKPVRSDEVATKNVRIRGYFDSISAGSV
jgi:hypothetical protein